MMKHRVIWLAALPLAFAMASFANAGLRCGGCSDPCRSHGGCGSIVGAGNSGSCASAACAHGVRHASGAVAMGSSGCSCGNSGCGAGVGHVGHSHAGCSVVQASPSSCGAVAADGSYAMSAPAIVATVNVSPTMAAPAPVSVGPQIVCEPVTGYRVVMESTFVTETQYVNASETRPETRKRVRQVSKTVPVTFEDFRVSTVMIPKTETKTIEYSVLVPETSTKTVDVNVTVPVWNEVSENYTVKVPVVNEVQETYNVNVPRLRDETFTYTTYVPQTETVTKMQTVTNAVPVVKTRTVQRTVPSYTTQTVTKDYGHWETVVEEVAGSSFGAATVMQAAPVSSCAPSVACSSGTYTTGSCGSSMMAATVVSGGGCGSGIFAKSACGGCGQAHAGNCGCRSARGSSSCGCAAKTASCTSGCNSGCAGSAIVSGTVVASHAQGCGCGSAGHHVAQTLTVNAVAVAGQPACGAAPVTRTATRRVWVPNVVTEDVQVVTNEIRNEEVAYTVYEQQSTQVPYECAYVVYRPETRTGTKKVVEYVSEPRTRTRKVVSYNDEQRTRTRRELSYKTETKQETYPVVSYRTEKKTKEISFTVQVPTQTVEPFQSTRYENVTEDVVEEYTVNVQVPTTREVQVQVCKMVPRLVPYTYYPCSNVGGGCGTTSGCGSAAGCGSTVSGGCGCGGSVSAPATSGCGCGAASVATPASPCGCGK